MLVLTRRVGDDVVIDDTIHVTVLEIHRSKVRLDITTPDSVRVLRGEVRERGTDVGRHTPAGAAGVRR